MLFRSVVLMLCVVSLAACQSPSSSRYGYEGVNPNGRVNILVMGEDAYKGTVARDSRIFKRVVNALADQMHSDGFSVYDETAVTLDDFAQGRTRRSDAELIDIARSVRRPPIDVVVLFSIYPVKQEKGYTTKVKTRIEGRLLDAQSGRRLGNFEVRTPPQWSVSPSCGTNCLLESVGDNARIVANELGAVLSEKLSWMVAGNDRARVDRYQNDRGYDNSRGDRSFGLVKTFEMAFDGFSPSEVTEMEDYLMIFSGYVNHRPVSSRHRYAEFSYKSSISEAKLNRNMYKMLDRVGLRATVSFSGNRLEVTKITLRNQPGNKRHPVNDNW